MIIRKAEIIEKINSYTSREIPFLFAIDFDANKGFVLTQEEALRLGVLYNIDGNSNAGPVENIQVPEIQVHPVEFAVYRNAFDKVMSHLKRGDTYLINLTFPTRIMIHIDPAELFRASGAPYKLYVPGQFLVFSPEPFVRVTGNRIYSNPMKGTIQTSIPGAREILLADQKELFEHHTIVDLIRNDLSMVSTDVRVTRFRYLELIKTNREDLWQMSSEICGTFSEDYRRYLGDIIFRLLPAGSVTGAPKEKTVQVIRESEVFQRGFYTGIFGFFNGMELCSAVTIRYLELNRTKIDKIQKAIWPEENKSPDNDPRYPVLIYKSGGGITALSNVENEYDEMLKKVYVPLI